MDEVRDQAVVLLSYVFEIAFLFSAILAILVVRANLRARRATRLRKQAGGSEKANEPAPNGTER